MGKRPWPQELDRYSSLIGTDVTIVQGPGGNTSFKDGKTLWVKASGTRLKDAEMTEIFCGIDIQSGELLKRRSGLRPSIERDFHLIIPKPFVIHTHSLTSLSLAIEGNFGERSSEYPEIAFIPYARPGKDLCKVIVKDLDFKTHKGAILQNHGFLTWGDSMVEAYDYLMRFESKRKDIFRIDEEINSHFTLIDHPKAVTPDYAVFLSRHTLDEIFSFTDGNLWKKQMFLVIHKAASYIDPKSRITYLTSKEVRALQSWESEKFRITLNK